MDSKVMKQHAAADLKALKDDLIDDAKSEFAHVSDPAQCGVVVRRHFNGLMITLYILIFVILIGAGTVAYFYTHS